jgi:hypothetical protein
MYVSDWVYLATEKEASKHKQEINVKSQICAASCCLRYKTIIHITHTFAFLKATFLSLCLSALHEGKGSKTK